MRGTREQLYVVHDSNASPVGSVSLSEAGFRERSHLQEWVLAHPQILGNGIRIVTAELGRWITGTGAKEADRLDVLGLDADGRLVVAELKRGPAPDAVEMQALKYAAMASRFTVEKLSQTHGEFLRSRGNSNTSDDDAHGLLVEHAPDLSDETLAPPRIVLVASGFPPIVTATTVFLNEVGLEVRLIEFHAYRTPHSEFVITVSQLFPVPSIEDFTISPAAAKKKAATERTRAARVVSRLVDADALADGTPFQFSLLAAEGQGVEAVKGWLSEDHHRSRATWRNHRSRPLIWDFDGDAYSPTGLVSRIYEEAAGDERPIAFWGPGYWVDENGKNLWELAAELS